MTNTPCQSKSGTAAIGARSGLALGCRVRNSGALIIIVEAGRSPSTQRMVHWTEDEEFMKLQHEALSATMPVRVVFLHLRKHDVVLGIDTHLDQIAPRENGYFETFPTFSGTPDNPQGEFDPKITGRHPWWQARFVGLSLSRPDQRLGARWGQSGESQREQPMIPIDENRDPFEQWNNTDPADHDRWKPDGTEKPRSLGRRGYALFQNEFEREVMAFHEEHGSYPKLMMVIVVDRHRTQYTYQTANGTNRISIGALGLYDIPGRFDRARSFWEEDTEREVVTHLSARTALGDAMRSVRDKYGVRSELSEYGQFPDFNKHAIADNPTASMISANGRKFLEVGERLKRALTIDGPLPGAPDHFAVPWPEP